MFLFPIFLTRINLKLICKTDNLEEKIRTACDTTQQCEELGFNGFKCVNNFCVCEGKMCGVPTAKAISTKIGIDCVASFQCKIEQSFCNEEGKCDCIIDTVASEDKRKCLNSKFNGRNYTKL